MLHTLVSVPGGLLWLLAVGEPAERLKDQRPSPGKEGSRGRWSHRAVVPSSDLLPGVCRSSPGLSSGRSGQPSALQWLLLATAFWEKCTNTGAQFVTNYHLAIYSHWSFLPCVQAVKYDYLRKVTGIVTYSCHMLLGRLVFPRPMATHQNLQHTLHILLANSTVGKKLQCNNSFLFSLLF